MTDCPVQNVNLCQQQQHWAIAVMQHLYSDTAKNKCAFIAWFLPQLVRQVCCFHLYQELALQLARRESKLLLQTNPTACSSGGLSQVRVFSTFPREFPSMKAACHVRNETGSRCHSFSIHQVCAPWILRQGETVTVRFWGRIFTMWTVVHPTVLYCAFASLWPHPVLKCENYRELDEFLIGGGWSIPQCGGTTTTENSIQPRHVWEYELK